MDSKYLGYIPRYFFILGKNCLRRVYTKKLELHTLKIAKKMPISPFLKRKFLYAKKLPADTHNFGQSKGIE